MPPVAPMLARAVGDMPLGEYSYEPKWDGFRSIVFRDGDEVEIASRNERSLTRYFPELVQALRTNLPQRCVVDGEIVVPDPLRGRLDFEALQQRIHPAESRVRLLAQRTPAHLVAFDLLALGDLDLTGEPFRERRRVLKEALADAQSPIHLTPATRDPEVAQRWFNEFEGAGLDGIVAKPLEGVYLPDKRVMLKIKHVRTADCVVAGYRPYKGDAQAVGSLLLGLYDEARRSRERRSRGSVPSQASPSAVRGVPAARHILRGSPLELGRGRYDGTDASEFRIQPMERRQGPLVRTAKARARRGGSLRPHGGESLSAYRPVRQVASRPRSALVHLRPA